MKHNQWQPNTNVQSNPYLQRAMMTDKERRRSPRVPCQDLWLTIKVGDQTGTTQHQQLPSRQVKVEDISDSGIRLISSTPFELGQIVYFFDPTLPSQGEVVWTCRSKIECKAGVQYIR